MRWKRYTSLRRQGSADGVLTIATLIFDGDCGFCRRCTKWARLRLPASVAIVPWQQLDVATYGLTHTDVSAAAWWVDDSGNTYRGHRAAGQALASMGAGWRIVGGLCLTFPFSGVAWIVYSLVARFRSKLPGDTR